ncbi:MAG TPA: GNAT family N-acyltransferase [Steroidobacter sp.]|uniref:lysophospholipid acyltransferase family protein n=1 Tax=Steroidobacter sp. TaxID=1978227 RepID=UPI002EDA58F5
MSASPFELAGPLKRVPAVGPLILNVAERALALQRLANIHRQLAGRDLSPEQFAGEALEILQVRFEIDAARLDLIPKSGPVAVVANHPYGGLEGLYVLQLLLGLRPDSKLIGNQLLQRIPELRDVIIPVDAFGGARAAKANGRGMRAALRHVQDGGLIVLFPAGAVSHLHLSAGRVCDPPWNPTAARFLRMAGCPVVPMHFGGGNSSIFQTLGLLHPRMRTVMLTHEFLNKRNHVIPVTVGRAIKASTLRDETDDVALARSLRLSTYALEAHRTVQRRVARTPEPTAEPVATALIEAEIANLPAQNMLAATQGAQVMFARPEQIPWTLREIGRLREIAFRAVDEGTGRSRDLDKYDEHYVHMFSWDTQRRAIIGAYRIGHVDEILAKHGRRGLYTHSLFSYGAPFLRAVGNALELGRSFIVPEHQRNFGALLLLWKGIAQYVARHPRYHVLIGPVSMSAEYRPHSQALLVDFIKRRCFDHQLAQLIRPRRPFRRTHSLAALSGDLAGLGDIEGLSELMEKIEPDGKGVPVLLRQYLKLGGRVVGFNVDANFSDVVDGMIVVDLTRVEPRELYKYMGREAAETFLASQPAATRLSQQS